MELIDVIEDIRERLLAGGSGVVGNGCQWTISDDGYSLLLRFENSAREYDIELSLCEGCEVVVTKEVSQDE